MSNSGTAASTPASGKTQAGSRRGPQLPPALAAERREMSGRAGRLSYYVAGEGPPLLLVHSINAAASAYEIRPIFEWAQSRHRVYAPDLPGFGFSDRSDRPYDFRLFVNAIEDMVDLIAREDGSGAIDALAVSLSAEFLARAASERPERFRTLTLVTPTGFSKVYGALSGLPGETREVPGLYRFFRFPVWSQGVYSLLVSRRSILFFLRRTFGSKNVDPGLVDYCYRTSHQPGAKNAPYAFVSGRLFSRDIRSVYEKLQHPIWMPHATRGDFRDFSGADWLKARPNWRVQPFDAGALMHFEREREFFTSFDEFLKQPSRR
jgi:pimeloyl-ACP methyl ester carboxylesterase